VRTYRELFRAPEYRPLFVTSTFTVAASTVTGLALATLVYADTGSPFLAALAMFGPSLAQVVGALVLLSAADRLPARPTLAGLSLLFGLGAAVIALGLPVGAAIAVVLALGPFASLAAGVRNGLLNQILPREAFLLGRSVLNIATGAVQIGGFAIGGLLLSVVSPAGLLMCAAALHLAGGAAAFFGLAEHPPRATGRPSVAATWRANAQLWSSAPRRYVLVAMCLPNGLIVGCE
jgi:MFS family permease